MKKMYIGLLTFHFSDNFGALLQAYALKTWLMDQGHSAEFINYHPLHVEEGGSFGRIWDPRRLRANAKIAYLKFSATRRRLLGDQAQASGFEAFRRKELGLTGTVLRTKDELEAHLAKQRRPYDLIIVGSDQIWNPSDQFGLDPVYFAGFAAGPQTRKISYAASFGRAGLHESFESQASELLRQLHGVSVREASGVALVEQLTGAAAECVPDPTILLGDFSRLIADAESVCHNQVFCYALRSDKNIREVANVVGQELSAEVVSPYNPYRRWREIGRTIYPSPSEFLATIAKSRFVVTNSFHGTAFSIILKKQFVVVGLPGGKSSLDERASSLLASVDLLNRRIAGKPSELANSLVREKIDWSSVEKRLAVLQEKGSQFLGAWLEIAS